MPGMRKKGKQGKMGYNRSGTQRCKCKERGTGYRNLKSVLPELKSELLKKRQQLEQMENEMKIRRQIYAVQAEKCNLKDVIAHYLSTVKVYDDKQIVVEFCI